MVWLRWFALGLIAGLSVLAFTWRTTFSRGDVIADFVAMVDQATVRRPNAGVFRVGDVDIGGDVRSSIIVGQESRIAWDHPVPDDAWLDITFAVVPPGPDVSAASVLFRAGLSANDRYEELFMQVLDPRATPADRAWRSARIDLSAYAGRSVSLIFNTAPAGDASNMTAAWGTIRLMAR